MVFKKPLSEILRPRECKEVYGQEHLCGDGGIIKDAIERKILFSFVLWGVPGCGKTTVAELYVRSFNLPLLKETGSSFQLKSAKKFLNDAKKLKNFNGTTSIVFIDEIHRLNKAQQDVFLPYIEDGTIVLVGTTTENPSFELNKSLISRIKVIRMNELDRESVFKVFERAKDFLEREYGFNLEKDVFDEVYSSFGNDLRAILNTLMLSCERAEGKKISSDDIKSIVREEKFLYDKKGDYHYDLISALHKSIRNSDIDSSLYYLERMLSSGEDRRYILRRLIRIAGEDIGLADPKALDIAISCFNGYEIVGSPEGEIFLYYAVVYLSLSPKSNSIYLAEKKTKEIVRKFPDEAPPFYLRNPVTELTREIGYGKGYEYAHDYREATTAMETMPEKLRGVKLFFPKDIGFEKEIKKRFEYWKRVKESIKKRKKS